jgi:preprotein translocase subunit SecA
MVSLEDELFVRFAPLLRAIALRSAVQGKTVPPKLLNMMVDLAQIMAERHNRAIRMSTIQQDRKLQSLLAFSGTPT